MTDVTKENAQRLASRICDNDPAPCRYCVIVAKESLAAVLPEYAKRVLRHQAQWALAQGLIDGHAYEQMTARADAEEGE